MSLYAIDKIEEALQRTKDIILPFDFMNWTRLAVITFFVGGLGGANLFTSFPTPPETGSGGGFSATGPTASTESLTGMASSAPSIGSTAILGIGLMFLLAAFIYLYVSSVFKFVFYQSLRDKNVRIRRNFSKHYRNGFKYFLFKLAFVGVFLSLVLGVIAGFMVSPLLGVLLIFPMIPVAILLSVFGGIVNDFALQEMLVEEKGLLASIKSSLSTLKQDWREFGGYILFRLIVTWAVAIISTMLMAILAVILAIPVLILVLVGAAASNVVAGGIVAVGVLLGLVLILYLNVPFRTYVYSYFVELYDAFMG